MKGSSMKTTAMLPMFPYAYRTPQIYVAVGLAICGCNKPSPGLLELGEFGMTPGPLVAGEGSELGGFSMDPCPLAAGVGATIPPGEGLEIVPEATSDTVLGATNLPT